MEKRSQDCGRKIVNHQEITDSRGNLTTQISVEGEHNSITIAQPIFYLSNDQPVLEAQRKMLEPLTSEGVKEFVVVQDKKCVTLIDEIEISPGYFDVVAEEKENDEEPPPTQTIETILMLLSPVFVEDHKWDFLHGDHKIFPTIQDKDFVRSVFSGSQRFGVGDQFRVKLRITHTNLPNGKTKISHDIVKILDVKKGHNQQELPLGGDPQ